MFSGLGLDSLWYREVRRSNQLHSIIMPFYMRQYVQIGARLEYKKDTLICASFLYLICAGSFAGNRKHFLYLFFAHSLGIRVSPDLASH
jgi:hypothetical protein